MKRIAVSFIGLLSLSAMQAQSPYVTRVLDFCPAPGQFVNVLPEYEPGDDKEAMIAKAEEYIVGKENGGVLSLGAWGGYVVVGFDHPVVNVPDEYDFKVNGNAFNDGSEPGIVMVSRDVNGNGSADDPWYELAGSEYHKRETKHDYKVVYYKPDPDHIPALSDNPSIGDTRYIRWSDNRGGSGYVEKNTFHSQAYFPEWIEADTLEFYGSRLADNGMDESGQGGYFVLHAYDWGYADNHPNASDLSKFKIEWAVDAGGNPVQLPYIDFIKVYTGVLQQNGWLGECSTEISGVTDLHPTAGLPTGVCADRMGGQVMVACTGDVLHITLPSSAGMVLYTPVGQVVMRLDLPEGANTVPVAHLSAGIYLLQVVAPSGVGTYKIFIP